VNEAILAKFYLQYGTIDEFIKDKFIDSQLFPDAIQDKLGDMSNNYENVVKEAVEEIYDEVIYDEEKQVYLHPETQEEVYYDNWSEWWSDLEGEIIDELVNELVEMIFSELNTTAYDELVGYFSAEVETYLQESLDDEWHNYR
jgi:hypothetical protein